MIPQSESRRSPKPRKVSKQRRPAAEPFPLDLFKSLLLRYLRECCHLDPKDVRRASAAGRPSICVGYESADGGMNFSVISWSMADELGISEDDDEANLTSDQNDTKSDEEGGADA
jgi:hypothetical protein